MTVNISRRRAITIVAAGIGLPLALKAGHAQARPMKWEGSTLGASSSIILYHQDEAKARKAIESSLQELSRLERIFSVYRADSAISILNQTSRVDNAPEELVELLSKSLRLAQASKGSYDPSIQPLWQLYFHHFTQSNPDPNGPSPSEIQAAKALVDWQNVKIEGNSIYFAKPGMAITLNSGAQGYITDKVANVLRQHGFSQMLVDMGEQRALEAKPDGSAWKIGIANPANPKEAIAELQIVDKAVATSGGYGTLFDDAGKFSHIIDPRTGLTVPSMLGVSVIAKDATTADGLATALLLASTQDRKALLQKAGGEKAIFVTKEGIIATVEA